MEWFRTQHWVPSSRPLSPRHPLLPAPLHSVGAQPFPLVTWWASDCWWGSDRSHSGVQAGSVCSQCYFFFPCLSAIFPRYRLITS